MKVSFNPKTEPELDALQLSQAEITKLCLQTHYDPKELHFAAEQFEHFTDAGMRAELADRTDSPPTDPHGREIPDDTPKT